MIVALLAMTALVALIAGVSLADLLR